MLQRALVKHALKLENRPTYLAAAAAEQSSESPGDRLQSCQVAVESFLKADTFREVPRMMHATY